MLYELAEITPNGLVHGGIAASLRTVGRWYEQIDEPSQINYCIVQADADAIPVEIYKKHCEAIEADPDADWREVVKRETA